MESLRQESAQYKKKKQNLYPTFFPLGMDYGDLFLLNLAVCLHQRSHSFEWEIARRVFTQSPQTDRRVLVQKSETRGQYYNLIVNGAGLHSKSVQMGDASPVACHNL